MTTTAPTTPAAAAGQRDVLAVLASARAARKAAEAAEIQVLVDAVDWAVANPPVFGRDAAAAYVTDRAGQRPVRESLSAEGVPELDRAAVAEYGLALGCSTQAAQRLIGDALELAYRLPLLWTRVIAGEVKPWRARQVAQATRILPTVGAGFVDRQVAPTAHCLSGAQLERLVSAAMARYDEQTALAIAEERRESRGFDIDLANTSLSGLTSVSGRLDLPDALNLDAAVAHAAQQLAAWGSTQSLDVRRAQALGDLARQHLTWNGQPAPTTWRPDDADRARDVTRSPGDGATSAEPGVGGRGAAVAGRVPPRRQVVLYLHLTDAAFADQLARQRCGDDAAGPLAFGRVENTGTPVTAETIREWCSDPRTSVSVRPVLDLAETLHAESYEIPARLREQVRLRDGGCVFPGCHSPGLHCQDDHCDPYDHAHPDQGGQTETGNLRLLCQRHHTLKTHHGFTYTVLPGGAVLWRTPHGLRIRRNRDGTTSVDGLPAAGSAAHADPAGPAEPPEP